MWYLRAQWHHDFADEPVEMFSEIGDDGFEVRKVEVYSDGRMDWADSRHGTGTTSLSQMPIPTVDEIDTQFEYSALEVDSREFESVWLRALAEQPPNER
ncbi:hypothetical protein OHA40_10520 [Nocardia sp. NBC_00508]|uniref:DUF6881 domain-containing protein n=1 Tax=Nocardia sp. NBC_00508 TaxID=2975992 RepID=UPI002E7FD294|nr:hypothetical protein [Nocardia sp. NBC_00508]WUD68498.1 hypothetical protein OHA40_10520 [Nocardia sp. NBC_00508]